MDYKIIQAHIEFSSYGTTSPYVVTVAIQSDIQEESPTHYKAYYKQVEGPEIKMDTFQHVAGCGEKLSKHDAAEIFPQLRHLKYY